MGHAPAICSKHSRRGLPLHSLGDPDLWRPCAVDPSQRYASGSRHRQERRNAPARLSTASGALAVLAARTRSARGLARRQRSRRRGLPAARGRRAKDRGRHPAAGRRIRQGEGRARGGRSEGERLRGRRVAPRRALGLAVVRRPGSDQTELRARRRSPRGSWMRCRGS